MAVAKAAVARVRTVAPAVEGLDFGEGGEDVSAEMLPGVDGIRGGGRTRCGGGNCMACDPQSAQSVP